MATSGVAAKPTSSIKKDAVIVLIVAAGLVGFYALFKAVSVLAGLPFP